MAVKPPFIRSAYNYDLRQASDEAATPTVGESLTVQSMTEDADINVIVRRFGLTGVMPQGTEPLGYADFEDIFDFQSAQNAIIAAQRSFDSMPAEVRARFNNNPQAFLEFCTQSKDGQTLDNLEEMRRLGLAVKPPEKPQEPVSGGEPAPTSPPPK